MEREEPSQFYFTVKAVQSIRGPDVLIYRAAAAKPPSLVHFKLEATKETVKIAIDSKCYTIKTSKRRAFMSLMLKVD